MLPQKKKKKYASCSLSIIKDDIETTLLITNGFIKNWINNNNKFLCKLRIYVKLNNLYTVNHVLSPKFKFFHEIDLREVTGEIEKEITYWTRSIKANIRDTREIYELCKADITSINIKHKDELIDGKPIKNIFFILELAKFSASEYSELFIPIYEVELDKNNKVKRERKHFLTPLKEAINTWFTIQIKGYLCPKSVFDDDEEHEDLQKLVRERKCVICLSNKPNVLYFRCGHIPTCTYCEDKGEIQNCPLCRKPATEGKIKVATDRRQNLVLY